MLSHLYHHHNRSGLLFAVCVWVRRLSCAVDSISFWNIENGVAVGNVGTIGGRGYKLGRGCH